MLQVSFIRQHIDLVKERLSVRYFSDISLVDKVVELDEQVRKLKVSSETLQAEMNAASKEIGLLMGKGEKDLATEKRQQVALQKNHQPWLVSCHRLRLLWLLLSLSLLLFPVCCSQFFRGKNLSWPQIPPAAIHRPVQ